MSAFVAHGPRGVDRAGRQSARRCFRVLVADDSEFDRELTIRCLTKAWPFERDLVVECAEDGAEVLEKLRSGRFALVVLDWNMPRVDGGTVLRTMRENGLCIPVVVVSGERREDLAIDLGAIGAAFVSKDALNPLNLRTAIGASVDLRVLSDQVAVRAELQCQSGTPSTGQSSAVPGLPPQLL